MTNLDGMCVVISKTQVGKFGWQVGFVFRCCGGGGGRCRVVVGSWEHDVNAFDGSIGLHFSRSALQL